MPLRINVGLSKKVGLPDYGSLGASCHVEYEADASLLNTDLEGFQRQVKNAYIACRQAVQDELRRHQAIDPALQGNRNVPASRNGAGPQRSNGSSARATNAHSANGGNNGQRRTSGRKATASQVRALEAIGNRLQLDLQRWLFEKYGLHVASELSIADASSAIEELNSAPSNGVHN
jgi:hypothetical protein